MCPLLIFRKRILRSKDRKCLITLRIILPFLCLSRKHLLEHRRRRSSL